MNKCTINSQIAEARVRFQMTQRLKDDQAKPPRHKKLRDKYHLVSQAQGQFINKPAQIFINPTDHQIDKIMNGELWGYKS